MHTRELFNKMLSILIVPVIILIIGLMSKVLFVKTTLVLFSIFLIIIGKSFVLVNHFYLKWNLNWIKNILISIVFIIIIVPIVFLMLGISFTSVNSFEECEAAGYDVMEIFPPKCKTPMGKIFSKTLEKEYISNDLAECKITVIMCEKGLQFNDEKGCGCQF